MKVTELHFERVANGWKMCFTRTNGQSVHTNCYYYGNGYSFDSSKYSFDRFAKLLLSDNVIYRVTGQRTFITKNAPKVGIVL